MSKTAADGPVRVLLVDDDRDDYLLTRDLLDEIPGDGYTLDWVSDYESAVAALDKCDHDVALVDYLLGARTGLDLLAEARRSGCKIPVILLTGKAVWEVDDAALGGGAAD